MAAQARVEFLRMTFMAVSASVCVFARTSASLVPQEGIWLDLFVQTKHFFSAKRAKIRSDLNPNASDFSQNANSVECRRLIVEQKCKKKKKKQRK